MDEPVGQADPETYTFGICGFVCEKCGECPRCKRQIEEVARKIVDTGEERDVLDQVADLLDGDGKVD